MASRSLAVGAAMISALALAAQPLAEGSTPPATPQRGSVVVTVSGLRTDAGQVMGAIWRQCKGFPIDRSGVVLNATGAVKGGVSTLTFKDMPFGTFAVTVLHDENKSGEADYNFIGLPVEGFGFSRNPRVFTSAPDFSETSFSVDTSHVPVAIKIKYL